MIRTSVSNHLNLKQQLELLALPPARRKRLLKKTVRGVKQFSRARIRQQRDLNGKPWARRKDNKNRKKMLRGLSKQMRDWANADRGVVDFKGSPLVGKIARAQQEGINEVMTSERMTQIHGRPNLDDPATRRQARALKARGFKRGRGNGNKGRVRASAKWIRENLKVGQAGLILREMRDKVAKKNWIIHTTGRSFLGTTKEEIDQLVRIIFNDTRQQMRSAGQR